MWGLLVCLLLTIAYGVLRAVYRDWVRQIHGYCPRCPRICAECLCRRRCRKPCGRVKEWYYRFK